MEASDVCSVADLQKRIWWIQEALPQFPSGQRSRGRLDQDQPATGGLGKNRKPEVRLWAGGRDGVVLSVLPQGSWRRCVQVLGRQRYPEYRKLTNKIKHGHQLSSRTTVSIRLQFVAAASSLCKNIVHRHTEKKRILSNKRFLGLLL